MSLLPCTLIHLDMDVKGQLTCRNDKLAENFRQVLSTGLVFPDGALMGPNGLLDLSLTKELNLSKSTVPN